MGRKLRFEKPQVGQQGHSPYAKSPPLMDLMERLAKRVVAERLHKHGQPQEAVDKWLNKLGLWL